MAILGLFILLFYSAVSACFGLFISNLEICKNNLAMWYHLGSKNNSGLNQPVTLFTSISFQGTSSPIEPIVYFADWMFLIGASVSEGVLTRFLFKPHLSHRIHPTRCVVDVPFMGLNHQGNWVPMDLFVCYLPLKIQYRVQYHRMEMVSIGAYCNFQDSSIYHSFISFNCLI